MVKPLVNQTTWARTPVGIADESEKGRFDVVNRLFGHVLPELVLYHDPYFEGREYRTNLNIRFLENHNNSISSIVIVRGKWRFYNEPNFQGEEYWDLSIGYYPWLEYVGIPDNCISSFQCIGV